MLLLLLIYLFTDIYSSTSFHFGHSLDDQKNWHRLKESYSQCAFGAYQTPIHIERHHVEDIVMPSLDFTGYDNYLPTPLTLTNNGHTVKLTAGEYNKDSLYNWPSISGALLNSSYTFDSLHFHWGQTNDRGSEHVLYHVRYPMEMHLVHRNMKYRSNAEALKNRDGLVVLAFFFHIRVSDNGKYRTILNNLRYLTELQSSTFTNRTFSLSTILPKYRQVFFTYEGSLTTPPCSESVHWFIFPETIPISFSQMELFRSIAILDNYRTLQAVGQRRIYLRRDDKISNGHFDVFNRSRVLTRQFWLH